MVQFKSMVQALFLKSFFFQFFTINLFRSYKMKRIKHLLLNYNIKLNLILKANLIFIEFF